MVGMARDACQGYGRNGAVRSNGELGGDVRIGKRFVQLMGSPRDVYEVLQGPGLEVQRRFGISRVQQVRQALRYKRRLGAMREEYYEYEFYRPEMSEDAKDRYVMQFAWVALSDVLNRSERNLDRSKLLQSRRFAEADIPTPRTLGYTAYAPTESNVRHQSFSHSPSSLASRPRAAACSNRIGRSGDEACWCSSRATVGSSSRQTEGASTSMGLVRCCASGGEDLSSKSASPTILSSPRLAYRASPPCVS